VLGALAAGLLLLSNAGSASAHAPHPGLDFSMEVLGVDNCDTRAGDNISCSVSGTFVVQVSLNALPGDIPDYQGFDIVLSYTGVNPLEDADAEVWPDCAFPAQFYDRDGSRVAMACAYGVSPAVPSTYTGPIATNSFECSSAGSVSLTHGLANTDLAQTVADIHAERGEGQETINVNCSGPTPRPVPDGGRDGDGTPGGPDGGPGPVEAAQTAEAATVAAGGGGTVEPEAATETAEARATATERARRSAGGGDGDDDGMPVWIWIVIGVGAVAAAGGLGFVGWRYWNARRGAAPGP
jgi:hypothetical protein